MKIEATSCDFEPKRIFGLSPPQVGDQVVRHSGAVKMTKNENSKKFEKSKIWVGDQVVGPSGAVDRSKFEST